MNVLSKILIGIGLLITVPGNLATFYGLYTSVNGMKAAESNGIGQVVSGMSFAYSCSVVSIIGCFILIVGIVLAAFNSSARRRP